MNSPPSNLSPLSPELFSAHADWIRRLALTLVRDTALADDMVQETWMAMLRHPPALDRPLRPWLAEVLRNFVRTWTRGQGRRTRRELALAALDQHEPSPETLVTRLEAQQTLSALVLALPEPLRQTILLRYTEGLTAAEISRRLKIPAGTVRWRLKEGLDQVRAQLDERAGGDRQGWRAGLIATFGLPRLDAPAAPAAGPGGPPVTAAAWKAPVLIGLVSLALLGALVPLGLREWGERSRADAPTAPAAVGPRARGLIRPTSTGAQALAGAIEGVVLDPDGQPLPRALVSAVSQGEDEGGPVPAAAAVVSADPGGRFRLEGLAPGSYGVSATAAGFAPASASAVAVNAGESRGDVTLRLAAGGVELTGVIEDRGGGVIPGASVRARPRHGPRGPSPIFHALADEQGRYVMRLPRGAHDLYADANGYTRVEGGFETRGALAQYRRDFRLHPAGRLRGVVIDQASGLPVAQAEVSASAGRSGFGEDAFTTTNAEGVFEFDDLEPGEYALRARTSAGPESLAGASGRAFILPTAGFIGDVRLTLQRGVSLTGRVRDPAGRPLGGASILVDEGRAFTRSASDGSFRVQGLLPGLVTLQPTLRGHGGRPVRIEVTLGQAPPLVELTLQPAAAIKGRVLDATGAPVAGAEITARTTKLTLPNHFAGERRDTFSAADGSFTIDEIAGTDDVYVKALHRDHGGGAVTVPQEGAHQVTITLSPGGSLAGTVRFADGTPAAGVTVLARNPGGGPGGVTFSAEDGSYWLGFFAEALALELTASTRQTWIERRQGAAGRRRRVEVRKDERRTGVDLVISRAAKSINGVVLDPEGKPLGGALVSAHLVMGEGDAQINAAGGDDVAPTVSAADGSFTLGDLDTESYRILARFPGLPDVKLPKVAAGGPDLRLKFGRGVALAGVVLDQHGKPATHYSLLVNPHRQEARPGADRAENDDQLQLYDQVADRTVEVHDASGAFSLGGLPAGVYDLRAETAEGAMGPLPPLSLAPGEAREGLQLRVATGIAVTGRVVDALTGAAVTGVQVDSFSFVARRGVTSGGDGSFRLAPLPRDTRVQISVNNDSGRSPAECKIIRTPRDGDVVDVGTIKLLAQKDSDQPRADIGAQLWAHPEGTLVTAVQPGTAAARAGIVRGDRFTSIGGRDVTDWGPIGIMDLLEGAPGTTVTATVRSGSTGALRTVTLRRAAER